MDWIAVCCGKQERKIDLCGDAFCLGGIFREGVQGLESLTSSVASFLPLHAQDSIDSCVEIHHKKQKCYMVTAYV